MARFDKMDDRLELSGRSNTLLSSQVDLHQYDVSQWNRKSNAQS